MINIIGISITFHRIPIGFSLIFFQVKTAFAFKCKNANPCWRWCDSSAVGWGWGLVRGGLRASCCTEEVGTGDGKCLGIIAEILFPCHMSWKTLPVVSEVLKSQNLRSSSHFSNGWPGGTFPHCLQQNQKQDMRCMQKGNERGKEVEERRAANEAPGLDTWRQIYVFQYTFILTNIIQINLF